MKAQVEVPLRTREVYQLFRRKMAGDRLFLEAILRRMSGVAYQARLNKPEAAETYQMILDKILTLSKRLVDERLRFETLLATRSYKIEAIIQFKPTIAVNNPLAMHLVELIETYDQLMTVIKLLRLAGLFESDEACWGYVRQLQKTVNRNLSSTLLQIK